MISFIHCQKPRLKMQQVPGGTEYFVRTFKPFCFLMAEGGMLTDRLDLISAGIVLVLAESSGANFSDITLDQQENSWKECLETLDRMVDVHPSGRDYYIALYDLRKSYTTQQAHRKIFIFQFPFSHISSISSIGRFLIIRIGPDQYQANQLPPDTLGNNEVNQILPSMWDTDDAECNALGPFFRNWDAGLGDIMLPAQVLQDLDEGLLLPSLF